jgi:hypothetical protein
MGLPAYRHCYVKPVYYKTRLPPGPYKGGLILWKKTSGFISSATLILTLSGCGNGRRGSKRSGPPLRPRWIALRNTGSLFLPQLYLSVEDTERGRYCVPQDTTERGAWRERRAKFGELVQTDATPYDWFGTGVHYALHGFQDDATGEILGLYLCEYECLQGYFEAFRPVLTGYGVPEALYADRIGIYFVNTKKVENWTIEEQLAGKTLDKTQFGSIAET